MGNKFLDVSNVIGKQSINENIADQVLNSVDTYVVGSKLLVRKLTPRSAIRHRLWLTKTAAGVATPTFDVRVGTAGTIADASRIQFTGPAQTAVVDVARVEILTLVRDVDATGHFVSSFTLLHDGGSTGFASQPVVVKEALSSAFDNDNENLNVGLSINPGAAGVWTVRGVIADLIET